MAAKLLPFLAVQPLVERLQRKTTEVSIGCEATFLGGQYSIVHIGEPLGGVGIGIDRDQYSFIERFIDPLPVQVKSTGVGIQLNDHSIGGTSVNDLLMIDGISFSAQQ
jgi:hypothetical protein